MCVHLIHPSPDSCCRPPPCSTCSPMGRCSVSQEEGWGWCLCTCKCIHACLTLERQTALSTSFIFNGTFQTQLYSEETKLTWKRGSSSPGDCWTLILSGPPGQQYWCRSSVCWQGDQILIIWHIDWMISILTICFTFVLLLLLEVQALKLSFCSHLSSVFFSAKSVHAAKP